MRSVSVLGGCKYKYVCGSVCILMCVWCVYMYVYVQVYVSVCVCEQTLRVRVCVDVLHVFACMCAYPTPYTLYPLPYTYYPITHHVGMSHPHLRSPPPTPLP
jgi:hypothetical protein